ncbi:MAG TPA: hypothetical protein VG759_06370 [Candidatus Angelobacter sp.]|jgi:hypothetical protein|nr:hypothetical protein [Candidatus Angelobacter sp.]
MALLAEIKEIAERPTLAELRERLHQRKPVAVQLDSARMVREEREARCCPGVTRMELFLPRCNRLQGAA